MDYTSVEHTVRGTPRQSSFGVTFLGFLVPTGGSPRSRLFGVLWPIYLRPNSYGVPLPTFSPLLHCVHRRPWS